MLADNERARLTKLFTETLTAFCRVGLEGQIATKVDALIGITFDNNEVLLIKVDKCLTTAENQEHHCTLDKSKSDLRVIKLERVSGSYAELEGGTVASGSDCSEKRSGDRSSCKRKLLDIDLHAVEENWQQSTGHDDVVKADGSKCRDCVEIDLGSLDLDLDCTNVDSTYFVENEPTSSHMSKGFRRASSGKKTKLAACRRSKAVSGSVAKRRNSLQKNETETSSSNAESAPPSDGQNYTIGDKNVQLTAELVSTFIEELPDMPDSVRCKLCGMQGGRAYMLRDHVNGVHLLPRRYSCQHCGQNFKWRSSLYRHRTLCSTTEHLVSVDGDADVDDRAGRGGTR